MFPSQGLLNFGGQVFVLQCGGGGRGGVCGAGAFDLPPLNLLPDCFSLQLHLALPHSLPQPLSRPAGRKRGASFGCRAPTTELLG